MNKVTGKSYKCLKKKQPLKAKKEMILGEVTELQKKERRRGRKVGEKKRRRERRKEEKEKKEGRE